MNVLNIWLPDKVHAKIERLTNPALPEREALESEKNIILYISPDLNEIVGSFAIGGGRTGSTRVGYKKSDLYKMLLIGFYKAWRLKDADPKWQAQELQELKIIVMSLVPKINKVRRGKNIGGQKITKQLLLSAILHRIISTQNLKDFFEKTL
jgi:hypothetical protein